jgi:alkylation response protein AidB-like acyl-CoA dehydrogenase
MTPEPVTASSVDAFRQGIRDWLDWNRPLAEAVATSVGSEQIEAWKTWSRELWSAGLCGLTWPQEFGGRGLSHSMQAVWLEERAQARVPDHIGLIGINMAGPTIIRWGSEDQKRTLLRPILDASEVWCQGFSEPESGSDLASIRTRATLTEAGWTVSGQKVWSSFAHFADRCLLLTVSDPDAPRYQGLTMFLLDLRSAGVEIRPLRQITGDPEFNEIFIDQTPIADRDRLGPTGSGWRVAMTTLSHERGTYGIALAATLDVQLQRATRTIHELGDSIPENENSILNDRLVRIWIELQALIETNRRSLTTLERTGQPGAEATISKLRWSLLNQEITALVADTLGYRGLDSSEGPEGYWAFERLRSRGNTVEAGTTEVLRNIIAERVLMLPRSR